MKKIALILFAVMMTGIFSSCKSQNKPPEEPKPPITQPENSSDSQTPDTSAPKPEAKVFSGEEVTKFFGQTEADIISIYGKPEVRREMDFAETPGGAAELRYGETLFEFEFVSSPEGQLALAVIADDKISAPREIKIGDTPETVLANFPNEKNGEKIEVDGNRKVQVLYGSPEQNGVYGSAEYAGNELIAVRLADTGVLFSIEFSKGKVARFRYVLAIS